MKKFFLNLWATFLTWLSSPQFSKMLINYLKDKAVKVIIAKFLIAGNLKIWLVKFLADFIFEEGDDKIIEPLFRKIGYKGKVVKGRTIYEPIKNAQTNDDWYDGVDNA